MDFARPHQGERLRLGLRNLYIVPTRFGWWWLAGSAMLQLVAIQMQSNGPLLLSFLMLGLFLLTLHLTHFNLQGLELRCGSPPPGFAGERLTYPLLARSRSHCEGLRLRLEQGELGPARVLPPGAHALALTWTPLRRGLQRPGRLRLQTTAPLGLFVCWSRWDLPEAQLVYPARRPGPVALVSQPSETASTVAASPSSQEGQEAWHDLRPHRPEDGSARLAWKLLAQGRGRHSKRFQAPPPRAALLAADPSVPQEQALEHLSEEICRLHARGEAYGLVLDGQVIPVGSGTAQRDRSLAALALAG